jgi:polyvinyl alcohol dehydrogenase (cytochrome)
MAMAMAIAIAVALAVLALPAAASADWPFYGHDLANSRNAGTAGPPAAKVTTMPRAWTFNSPTGDFTGTPAIAGGVVVAGDQGGHVYALDAVTGKRLWSTPVGAPVNGSAAIDTNAPGGATAYVPVAQPNGPRLVALSLADGATRWDATLTQQQGSSVYGSPVFWNGAVYIGTSGPNGDDSTARGSVVALDQASGQTRWQTFMVPPGRDGAPVWSTPAIDTATGRLYVGTGNNYHAPATDLSDAIVAMDAATGQVLGHHQATAGDSFAADNPAGPDYDFGASPNLFDGPSGQHLVGEGQKSAVYWALDRSTMQPIWNTTVGPAGPVGGILGSTATDGARVYGADTLDGQVFALGHDGGTQWESADAGGLHVGATTLANGVLYTLDPNGALNARDPATGTILAKLPLDGPALGGVSAAGGAVFVAQGTGPLPEPAPQSDGTGSIVAFGDTSGAGAAGGAGGPGQPGVGAPKGRLRLSVRPRRVRADRLVRLRVRVTRGSKPAGRVTVRVGRRRVHTAANGRVTVRVRFRRPGLHVVRAGRLGAAGARATIRVTAARGG